MRRVPALQLPGAMWSEHSFIRPAHADGQILSSGLAMAMSARGGPGDPESLCCPMENQGAGAAPHWRLSEPLLLCSSRMRAGPRWSTFPQAVRAGTTPLPCYSPGPSSGESRLNINRRKQGQHSDQSGGRKPHPSVAKRAPLTSVSATWVHSWGAGLGPLKSDTLACS